MHSQVWICASRHQAGTLIKSQTFDSQENILLMPDFTPKIADFDLLIKQDTTKKYAPEGTESYMAPEVLEEHCTAKVDIYRLPSYDCTVF